jgi:general secretion pathway protein A
MYKKHFGLNRNPFEISPDPEFLYSTDAHREALAALYYGIRRHCGFVVLTGEVGTGKTLIIRCLLEILNENELASAYVFNPKLSALQLLQYIAGDLGLPSSKSKAKLLLKLNHFLIERHRQDLQTVLIVDEAQLLQKDLLEEIRLLTNLETSQQKLFQIVLAGQPELETKLDSKDLRQLKQRVTFRCTLSPFSPADTGGYIRHRLTIAGAESRADTIFPQETVTMIHEYSTGIPRLINTICNNSLISGYASHAQTISPMIISEVAADLRLKQQDSKDLNLPQASESTQQAEAEMKEGAIV